MANITYLQVVDAANELVGEGAKASIKAVRLKLKTGSPNTIQKFLTEWKTTLSKPADPPPQLPAALVNSIAVELASAAAQARAAMEALLNESQEATADLSEAGELLEAERDTLAGKVEALIHERDTIAGKAAQQSIQLTAQAERNTREQEAAESVRIELAKVQLKTNDLKEKIADLTKELERLRATLEAESKCRVAAELLCAVQAARLESATERVNKADARVELLEGQGKDVSNELKIAMIKAQGQQADQTATVLELSNATRRAEEANSAALLSDDVAKRAKEEAAELRGRLATLQQVVSDAQAAAKRSDQEAFERRWLPATTHQGTNDGMMAA